MRSHSDERTIATTRRWAALGMVMLSNALAIDLIVRMLILNQEPRQWLDIALIWMATNVCVAIGMAASGVAPFEGRRLTTWLVIVILAVEIPVVLTLMGMVHTPADFFGQMVIAAVSASVLVIILRGMCRVWERVKLGRVPREE